MTDERWYDKPPYGPLTKEDFNLLAVSYYEPCLRGLRDVARARGILRTDYPRQIHLEKRANTPEAIEVVELDSPENIIDG